MSNIDLSRIITAEDKAAKATAARARVVKDECRRRILCRMTLEAQQNIAQAMTIHTAEIMRGSGEAWAKAASGLAEGDFPVIYAGREWIASMQAASRAMAQDTDTDPTDDVAWPAPPDGLAALVARF